MNATPLCVCVSLARWKCYRRLDFLSTSVSSICFAHWSPLLLFFFFALSLLRNALKHREICVFGGSNCCNFHIDRTVVYSFCVSFFSALVLYLIAHRNKSLHQSTFNFKDSMRCNSCSFSFNTSDILYLLSHLSLLLGISFTKRKKTRIIDSQNDKFLAK